MNTGNTNAVPATNWLETALAKIQEGIRTSQGQLGQQAEAIRRQVEARKRWEQARQTHLEEQSALGRERAEYLNRPATRLLYGRIPFYGGNIRKVDSALEHARSEDARCNREIARIDAILTELRRSYERKAADLDAQQARFTRLKWALRGVRVASYAGSFGRDYFFMRVRRWERRIGLARDIASGETPPEEGLIELGLEFIPWEDLFEVLEDWFLDLVRPRSE